MTDRSGSYKYFRCLRADVDVRPLLAEIDSNQDAWLMNTRRQDNIPVQRETNTIFIRNIRRPIRKDIDPNDNHDNAYTTTSRRFPRAVEMMNDVAKSVGGRLSRATIVRLKPNGRVYRHIDGGDYYKYRDRYHLVLFSPQGSVLIAGDEQVRMREGELWWFDNKAPHEALNEAGEWRIHCIFDILPRRNYALAMNPPVKPGSLPEAKAPAAGDGAPPDAPVADSTAAIRQCILQHCLTHAKDGEIVSREGTPQGWSIDLRRAFLKPDILPGICQAILDRLHPASSAQVAGMETAAIPLLSALLLAGSARGATLTGLLIRKERKRFGLGRAIEGAISGAPVILLDDTLNSGASAEKARVTLEQAGIKLERMFVVIDFETEGGLAWRRKHGIQVEALLKLADLGLSIGKRGAPAASIAYTKLWHHESKDGRPFHLVPKSAPLLVGEHLFFGTERGVMQALDSATGDVIWTFPCKGTGRKGIWSTPAHHAGRLYFGAYNGNVYCLDAGTGSCIWQRALCEWVGSSPLVVAGNQHLYIGLEYESPRAKGGMAALSLDTGDKVWEHRLSAYQHGSAAYWKSGDLVVFGTNDNDVRALNAKTGELVWRFETRGAVKYAPAVDAERAIVAFASFDRSIYVLDVRDGRKLGEFPTGGVCYTTPLIAHGRLFCGSGDGHLYAIDLDGMTLAGRIGCGARIYSSPRLIGGSVAFGTAGGGVWEIDPASLDVTGKLVVPDAVTNAIAATADGRRMFVPTYMNEVYAYARGCAEPTGVGKSRQGFRPGEPDEGVVATGRTHGIQPAPTGQRLDHGLGSSRRALG
jgi:outer membrane protein assembly factor BamB